MPSSAIHSVRQSGHSFFLSGSRLSISSRHFIPIMCPQSCTFTQICSSMPSRQMGHSVFLGDWVSAWLRKSVCSDMNLPTTFSSRSFDPSSKSPSLKPRAAPKGLRDEPPRREEPPPPPPPKGLRELWCRDMLCCVVFCSLWVVCCCSMLRL